MCFVDEFVHRLTGPAIDRLVQRQLPVIGGLLAMLLDEETTHRSLAIAWLDITAVPTRLPVAAFDHERQQMRLLAPEEAGLRTRGEIIESGGW